MDVRQLLKRASSSVLENKSNNMSTLNQNLKDLAISLNENNIEEEEKARAAKKAKLIEKKSKIIIDFSYQFLSNFVICFPILCFFYLSNICGKANNNNRFFIDTIELL